MRILFVSANREVLPDAVVPIGLASVAANTPVRHERQLLDLCFADDPTTALLDGLSALRPDVVAIGLRNLQSADYSGYRKTLDYYRSLVRVVREATDAPIVVGGGGFSVMPRGMMEYLAADYGISGEGEQAFPSLLERLESESEDLSGITGLHWYVDGELHSAPPASVYQDLDALVPLDRGVIDPRYYQRYGIDSIQTKRGCPLRCDYCTYPTIEGRSIRQRSPARVVAEMRRALEQYPEIDHFFIVDSVFNLPPGHAKAVCREIIRERVKVAWTCYANPIGFDQELADLMVEAGCSGIEVGSDSGVDAVLDRLRKGFRTDRIRALRRSCERAGLRDCHSFILGTQGETDGDVDATLEFCIELAPYAAIMGVWIDDYELLDTELAAQRVGFRDTILELLRRKVRDHPRWIVPALGVNFDPRLFRLPRRRGLKGPLWQHLHDVLPARRDTGRYTRAGVRVT